MDNKDKETLARKKDNKLIVIMLGIVVLVVGIFFGGKFILNSSNEKKMETLKEYEDKDLKELHQSTIDLADNPVYDRTMNPKKIEKEVSKHEESFVYLYSPECIHCKEFTPKFTDYLNEKGIDNVYYLNVLEYPEYFTKYNAMYTPTILKVSKENFVIDKIEGAVPIEEVKKLFKK